MITRVYPSSSGGASHTTKYDPLTGALTCTCRGFRSPSKCWHIKDIVQAVGPRRVDDLGTVVVGSGVPRTTDDIFDRIGGYQPVATWPVATRACPVKPMLASAMTGKRFEDYTNADWCLEEKYDGHRVIVQIDPDGLVYAWSRPAAGKAALPRVLPNEILDALKPVPAGTYDGELVAPGARSRSSNVTRTDLQAGLRLIIFDAPHILSHDLRKEPYEIRREALCVAMDHMPNFDRVGIASVFPVSRSVVDGIWDRGGEGAILKRRGSTYQPGRRSPDWIKVKKSATTVMLITGFQAGKSGPHSVALLMDEDARVVRAKVRDQATREHIAKDPKAYIGKYLVVTYVERHPDGAYLSPTWDHLAGPGERP